MGTTDGQGTPGPSVRDAVLGDAPAMSAVQARSWRVAYRGIAPDDFLEQLTDDAWTDRWSATLRQPQPAGAHHLVAVAGGSVVAVAACGPARDDLERATAELYLLYTDPDHWGQGHGSALLGVVHARLAMEHGAALLWVAAENARAIGFYEQLGWELDGVTRQDELNGVTFDEARMVRELS